MKISVKRSLALTALLATTATAMAGNITVKGSDTLVILAQKWAEIYMSKHAETKIQVTGGGSGIGRNYACSVRIIVHQEFLKTCVITGIQQCW